MRFTEYIEEEKINENIFKNAFRKIKNYSKNKLERLFKDSWMKIADAVKEQGLENEFLAVINSRLGTNYRKLEQISKARIVEERLDEDWKHFWEAIASEGFFNLKFWPALNAWMILGNTFLSYLKGTPIDITDIKAASFYAAMWLALASGKFVKDYKKWKASNPDEFYAERPKLAKKHGYVFKNPEMDPNKKGKKVGFI